jgi:hypothetical protein
MSALCRSAAKTQLVDLSEFRSRFANGWGDDDIDSILPRLSRESGLDLRCAWEYVDQWGFGGNSELIVVLDGQARELPDGLWELLGEGDGDGFIDPSTVGKGPHPDEWDLPAMQATYTSESGLNLAREDRTRDDQAEPPTQNERGSDQPRGGESPRLWTSWRDRRDGTIVTVVQVRWWNRRFAAVPAGGHGHVTAEVERRGRTTLEEILQWEFEEDFELIYDPYTGWEREPGSPEHTH